MDSHTNGSNASGSQARNQRPFSHRIADLNVRQDPDDSFDLQDGSLNLQDERLNSLNLQGGPLESLNLQDGTLDSLNLQEGTLGSLSLPDGTLDSLNLPEGHSLNGRHLHPDSVNSLNSQRETMDPTTNQQTMHGQEMMESFMNYMHMSHNGGQSSHQQSSNQASLQPNFATPLHSLPLPSLNSQSLMQSPIDSSIMSGPSNNALMPSASTNALMPAGSNNVLMSAGANNSLMTSGNNNAQLTNNSQLSVGSNNPLMPAPSNNSLMSASSTNSHNNLSHGGMGGGGPLPSMTPFSHPGGFAHGHGSSAGGTSTAVRGGTGGSRMPPQSPTQSPSSTNTWSVLGHFGPTSKHICAICGDRASGKHYGVYSCEGCKGFFKRTVRKNLSYHCREEKNCTVDKRQRNRCQFCRYNKCITTGMKREAVQEERQRVKEPEPDENENRSQANREMPVEKILEAETSVLVESCQRPGGDPSAPFNVQPFDEDPLLARYLCHWATKIPHFNDLLFEDKVALLKSGWNELLLSHFAHRSTEVHDSLVITSSYVVDKSTLYDQSLLLVYDRVMTELVSKMRDMSMDKTEVGCLRAITLFNPDAKGVLSPALIDAQREKVYASLEEYIKSNYPDETGRFARLLLRLPALRSIGLKCIESVFENTWGGAPLEAVLQPTLTSIGHQPHSSAQINH